MSEYHTSADEPRILVVFGQVFYVEKEISEDHDLGPLYT
jgi:hypothetical protein